MIKKLIQEDFIDSEYFDICADLYEEKYFLEDFYLDNISDLTFFIYILDEEVIGFGSHQILGYMNIVETLFSEEHKYSNHHSELLKFILNDLELEHSTYVHQSIQSDYDFYIQNGFELWKDYKSYIHKEGKDTMRWSLIYKNKN